MLDNIRILVIHVPLVLFAWIVNGSHHPSECDNLRRSVQRADLNSRTLDPETHLTGQWLSEGCESRPGPIHLLRHYQFYPSRHPSPHPALKFKLRHYYFSDAGCSQPLYSLNIHGSYRVDGKSWAVPDASQMSYGFHKIGIVGYNQAIVDELQHIVNESCSGHIFYPWSPNRQYTIFLSNLETGDLFSSRPHRTFTTAPPIHNKQDLCLANVYRMFQDLDLLKIVHRPLNAFDPYDRTKLYLGDLNTRVQARKSHVPTGFQVPLVKSTMIQGCDVCKAILKSSYREPPAVRKEDNLPLYLDGEWISGECETQPLGIFIKRNLYVTLNNFTYESNIYSDSACTSITMSVKYYGYFHVRELRDLTGRTTEEQRIAKETLRVERKPGESVPRKSSEFHVLPLIEMFANTQQLLSENALMAQSRVQNLERDRVYETVQDSDAANDNDGSNDSDKISESEINYKVVSEIESERWPKTLARKQEEFEHKQEMDHIYAATDTMEGNSNVDDIEQLEKAKEKNGDKNRDGSAKKSLVDLYEEMLNSKLDGEFEKEIIDNLLATKTHRHKRHSIKHGREHNTHNHSHKYHDRSSSSNLESGKSLPTNVWSEILPLALDHKKVEAFLPNLKVNQMNTIEKKDLEQFFVRHIDNEENSNISHKGKEMNEEATNNPENGSADDNNKNRDEVPKQSKTSHIKKHSEKDPAADQSSINMPQKILYWYGRPNIGQVPVLEQIAGRSVQLSDPSINPFIPETVFPNVPFRQDTVRLESVDTTPIRDNDVDIQNELDLKLNLNPKADSKLEDDIVKSVLDTDVNTDDEGLKAADVNEYLLEFHIEAADLKMYDYDLIENLKYDQNCAARYQLWGTIIGDTIPLRTSCSSLGIKLPHIEHSFAHLRVSPYNKLSLYLNQPDDSQPIRELEDPLAKHSRIVNYGTSALHKCKLYANDFYMEANEDIKVMKEEIELDDVDVGNVDGNSKSNKEHTDGSVVVDQLGENVDRFGETVGLPGERVKGVRIEDIVDEDEEDFDEPLEVVKGDYEDSVNKCDGSRSHVIVIFSFSLVALFRGML